MRRALHDTGRNSRVYFTVQEAGTYLCGDGRFWKTNDLYRYKAERHLGDWFSRPLDAISRRDVETRFNGVTVDHGWSPANRAILLLRSVYRRSCVDHEGLRNPVDLWLAGGGKGRRERVLPLWKERGLHRKVDG